MTTEAPKKANEKAPRQSPITDINSKLIRVRRAVLAYYTAPQAQQFKSLRNGFVLFAMGLATVLITNSSIPPSLEQEIVILLGLILGGIGFLLAIRAYVRIVISRIVAFFSKK